MILALLVALVAVNAAHAASTRGIRAAQRDQARATPPAAAATVQADSELLSKATPDVHFIVRWLNYSGDYQLQIENMSTLGTVNSFDWIPPPSLRVTAIKRTSGGACSMSSTGVSCQSKLAPPTCSEGSCETTGAVVTIEFTAALTGTPPGARFSDLFWDSYLEVTGLTPAPPPYVDLPLCAKGHSSTKSRPCTRA